MDTKTLSRVYIFVGMFGGIVIEFINKINGTTAGIGAIVYLLMMITYLNLPK